jgi:hypothetical protein
VSFFIYGESHSLLSKGFYIKERPKKKSVYINMHNKLWAALLLRGFFVVFSVYKMIRKLSRVLKNHSKTLYLSVKQLFSHNN